MFSNPELRRQSWLEFSAQRLVAMPIILALIFFIVGQASEDKQTLPMTALGIFAFLVNLWGGLKAAGSVVDDVNNNAWDLQRLSSVSPFDLTIGKLFGSALYVWYGAAICLVAYIIFAFLNGGENILFSASTALISGLICHATALLMSMQDIRTRQAVRKKKSVVSYFIFGLIVSGIVGIPFKYSVSNVSQLVVWYGTSFEEQVFDLFSSLTFLLWIVAGIYWQMRYQLRMHTSPFLWAGFIIYLIFYFSGFDMWNIHTPGAIARLIGSNTGFGAMIAFPIALVSLYSMVFLESWNGASYRRFLANVKKRNWVKAGDQCPRWLVSFVLVLISIPLSIPLFVQNASLAFFVFAMLGFAVRDIALLHYFKLSKNKKRAVPATLIYLLVLYVLIPALLGVLRMFDGMLLFLPIVKTDKNLIVPVVSGFFQATIVCLFAYAKWKKNWEKNN